MFFEISLLIIINHLDGWLKIEDWKMDESGSAVMKMGQLFGGDEVEDGWS